jgi:PAS domain S-box-containing protein
VRLRAELARSREALRVAEARIAGIVGISDDAIISIDSSQRITLFNRGAERIFGYLADEVLGRPLDLLLPERFSQAHRSHVRSFGSSPDMLRPMRERGEIFGRRKDGSEFPAEASISKFEVAGEPILNVRMRDITERKRAQEQLQTRARQQAAVASIGQHALTSRDLPALMDAATALVCETLAAPYCTTFELLPGGTTLQLSSGRGWREGALGRETIPAAASHAGYVLETGGPVLIEDLARETRFSDALLAGYGIVGGAAAPLQPHGQVFGVLGVYFSDRREFTAEDLNFLQAVANVLAAAIARTRAEEALRDSNETLRVVNQATPAAVWVLDLEGRIKQWNPAAERLFGWREQEVIGRPQPGVPESEQARVREQLDSYRRGQSLAGREARRLKKDGTPVDVGLWSAPLRDYAGRISGTVVTAVDLTARKRMEEQLRQSQKLESIGLLAGGIAHDFNNLLTGILGNISLALEVTPPNPGQRMLESSLRAAERAADLVRQLLAYAGKGRFVIEPVDLSVTVRDLAPLLESSISKKVSLKLDLDPAPPAVDADLAQMHQLIMNLAVNGAEAIGEDCTGEVAIRVRVRSLEQAAQEPALAAGTYVCLEVSDTGCGMDELTRAQIFDPFFTTKFTGRGLGLAAVAGIVRAHSGTVQVESAPGSGSTFRVWLPAAEQPARRAEPMAARKRLAGRGTILVVDDEAMVRQFARATLTRHGYSVLLAENGQDAVRLFRERPDEIAVILLDMSMPLMGGEETLRKMLAIRSGVRVIVSSGYDEKEAMRRFTGLGITAFLQKPYTANQLAAEVKSALDRSGTASM